VLDQRLVIVTGKGGVGRSAVASAIARTRAARGERILALAIDRGRGLAAHLGVPTLSHDPTPIYPNLHAAVVDPSSALEEYVRLQVRAPIAVAGRVFRLLALTVPGVRDIVLVGKVWHEGTAGDWDAVIVDASPAGQIQSIVRAPGTIADLVPRGTVHDQAQRMAATLADPEATSLVVVATPEELPLTEAGEVLAAADEAGITPNRSLVLNRVLQPGGFIDLPPIPGPAREAAALQLEVEAAQSIRITQAGADQLLPLLLGSHRPSDVSSALAARLEAP
jgi:anion-transporting  ArsA/GET3 family ATPase